MNRAPQAVGDDFDVPVVEAAASMLKDRLKRVRRRFTAAVAQGKKNAEPVHQLRVATRRAAAVLVRADNKVGHWLMRHRADYTTRKPICHVPKRHIVDSAC